MIKRFIWDLDGTILDGDFSKEEKLFKEYLSEEELRKFKELRYSLLHTYEKEYPRYDKKMLSKHLSDGCNANISEELIDKWINYASSINECIHPGVVEVLDYLNDREIENIIYSNWFTKTQVDRLKKVGLDSYFKEIRGADYYMKPSKEGFLYACGPYKPSECVMVGDNYDKDILGARNAGLETIYYSPKKDVDVPHIKRLIKIKEMLEDEYRRD